MEALLIIGVAALLLLGMGGNGGGEAQAAPKLPRVVYIVAEPNKGEADATGFLLVFALGIIALLALGIPS